MDIEEFKELLHARALKATSPRLNLLMEMQSFKSAMPYSMIQKAMEPIDRVTLYRTIESLKNQGIIHKAFQVDHEIYYAICSQTCNKSHHKHDHVHFRCVKCEAVTCEEPTKAIEISISDNEIHRITTYVEGVCRTCNSN